MDKELILKIKELRNNGESFGDIAKELLITKSQACYFYKVDLFKQEAKKHSRKKYENDVCELAKKCTNINQILRMLGKRGTNEYYNQIKKILEENNVDTSHFIENERHGVLSKERRPINELLINGSTIGSSKLRDRILNEGIKEHRCERCKRTEWEGEPIPLQLHHINGNRTDNRIENLQLLCPNCHTLTDNYCGKKLKKELKTCPVCGRQMAKNSKLCKHCYQEMFKKREVKNVYKDENINIEKIKEIKYKIQSKCPSKDELIDKFKEYGSFKGVGEYYKVSDNAIRKWCIKYSLPDKGRVMRDYIKELFGDDVKWSFMKTNDTLSRYHNFKYPKRCLLSYNGEIEKIYSSNQEIIDDGFSPEYVLDVCKGKLNTHKHRKFKFLENVKGKEV